MTVKSTSTAVRNTVNPPTSSIAGNVASFSQVAGAASSIFAAVSTVSYYEYVDTTKRLYEEKVQPILAKPREIWVNVEENIKDAWHEKTANCPEIVGELGDFVISKIPVIAHVASIAGMSSSARALSSIVTFVTYHMMSEKDQKVVKEVEKLGIDIALFAVGIGEAGAAIKGLASGAKALSLVGSAGSAGVVVVGSAVEVEGIADVALGAIAAAVAGSDASNHVNELADEFEESLSSKKENAGDDVAKSTSDGDNSSIPDKAKQIANEVKNNNGAPPSGYKGGRTYKNIPLEDGAQKLPDGISYREYDVNPYVKGQNRGAERIVIGDDGSVWYTNDHYFTFTQIE